MTRNYCQSLKKDGIYLGLSYEKLLEDSCRRLVHRTNITKFKTRYLKILLANT